MISEQSINAIMSAAKVEEVIQDFITLKKKGKDFESLCPFHNENTPSFHITPSKGIYKCFGCGKAGGSVNFLMEHQNMAFPDAIRYLGSKYNIPVEEDGKQDQPQKKHVKPKYVNSTALPEKHVQWFQGRALTQPTLLKMKIGHGREWMPDWNKEVETVQFPYIRNGEVVNIKYRGPIYPHKYKDKETGEEKVKYKKNFKMVTDAEKILFNLDSLKGQTEAIITEGEPDCMAYVEAGVTCGLVSVPNGGSTGEMSYLGNCMQEIKHIERWFISTDNDPTGIALRDELIRRFGKDKCFIVEHPQGIKDANDVLKFLGPAALLQGIKEAKSLPLEDVIYLHDIRESMLHSFIHGKPRGTTTYYPALDKHFTWKKGEVTLMHARPNHGKTTFMLQLMLIKSMREGDKWGIFSPENHPPNEFYDDLIHTFIGKTTDPEYEDQMSMDEYIKGQDFIDKHFFFVHPSGPATPKIINDKFLELIYKEGITGCLLDPYNQLDHDMNKYGRDDLYISDFMAAEKRFAQVHDVYKLIIIHPKNMPKPKSKDDAIEIPSPFDLHGGSMWNNKADNILVINRPYFDNSFDPRVQVGSQKIKKYRLVGRPGIIELNYDFKANRYNEPGGFGPWMRDPMEVLEAQGLKWSEEQKCFIKGTPVPIDNTFLNPPPGIPDEKRIQGIFNNINKPPNDGENTHLKFRKPENDEDDLPF